tara:strand:+ start:137 stop:430 length:294 start_codon:yes stop_codon:yes gene_type:complete
MTFENWLTTFVDETDKINTHDEFAVEYNVKGQSGVYEYKMSEVMDFLFTADEQIQERVKNDVVKMDFHNVPAKDFRFYFTCVARAMANVYMVNFATN